MRRPTFYPIGIRESRSVCETIQTSTNRDDLAGIPKSIQGARVNSQTQGVAGPKHSSVLAKGFPSEREICRNLRHNDGYNPRILYTVSELFIHALTRLLRYWPGAGDVSRGFTKGSIRVPEGAFCVKLWRSVPLVSITYDSVLPFHGDSIERGSAGRNYCGRNHA